MNYKWVSHCLTRISCVAPLSNVNWKRRNFLHFITINLNRETINVFSLLGSAISSGHKNCWNIYPRKSIWNHLQNHLTPCWTFGKTSISAISCHIKKSFKPLMCWRIFKTILSFDSSHICQFCINWGSTCKFLRITAVILCRIYNEKVNSSAGKIRRPEGNET